MAQDQQGSVADMEARAKDLGYVVHLAPSNEGETAGPQSNSPKIALLFGWTFSAHRPLSKYAEMYTSRGYNVVQQIRKGEGIVFKDEKNIKDNATLMEFVDSTFLPALSAGAGDATASDSPPEVLIHAFSNGGLCRYIHLVHAIQTLPEHAPWSKRIRGVVLDSSPADSHPASSTLAFTSHMPAGVYRSLVRGGLRALFEVGDRYARLRHGVGHLKRLFGFDMLLETELHTSGFPFLYLFSDADVISDPAFIEKWIEKEQARGVAATFVKFTGSAHVAHLPAHKEQYTAAVQGFIDALP